MKRLGVMLVSLSFGIMLASTALAVEYAIDFEADGGAAGAPINETIYGWDLEAFAKESVPVANNVTIFGTGTGASVDIVTHQQLDHPGDIAPTVLGNNDTFYESITVNMLNGLGIGPGHAAQEGGVDGLGGYYNANLAAGSRLFIDLSLNGHITGYNNGGTPTTATTPTSILNDTFTSIFDSGSARMYVDADNDKGYDVGETIIADFTLSSAGPFILTPSVFLGVGAQISFGFENTFSNASYISQAAGHPDPFNLGSNLWVTLTQGGVAFIVGEVGGLTVPDPDEVLIAFQETGFDAIFDLRPIPEPTSMLLLGTGLVGLAGARRRKRKAAKK